MICVKSIVNQQYFNGDGDLVDNLQDAFVFDSVDQATRWAIHAHILDPEYVDSTGGRVVDGSGLLIRT